MTLGMLQLLAVGFESNEFKGEIVPELQALQDKGLVRLIDLVFVIKDERGQIESIEVSSLSDEDKIRLGMEAGSTLSALAADSTPRRQAMADAGAMAFAADFSVSEEDVEEIAAELPNNSSALLILAEHLWSLPLKQAMINANGTLVGNWIIQPEVLEAMDSQQAAEPAAEGVR